MSETDELQADPQGDQQVATELPASARTLLRVVYIMGVILALLFLLLVGGIIWKSMNRAPAPAGGAAPVVDLGLPAGTAIQQMILDGDRLAISTGAEIIVVDVRKNLILSRVKTAGP